MLTNERLGVDDPPRRLVYRVVPAGPRYRLEFWVDGEWRRNGALTEDDEDSLARELLATEAIQ